MGICKCMWVTMGKYQYLLLENIKILYYIHNIYIYNFSSPFEYFERKYCRVVKVPGYFSHMCHF